MALKEEAGLFYRCGGGSRVVDTRHEANRINLTLITVQYRLANMAFYCGVENAVGL